MLLARIPNIMLLGNGEGGHSCLLSDHKRKVSNLPLLGMIPAIDVFKDIL
jgi:hypothetical protein